MAIAKARAWTLRWSFTWPLSKKKEKTVEEKELQIDTWKDLVMEVTRTAREIDAAGELYIEQREQQIGFFRVFVRSEDGGTRWIDIYWDHIKGTKFNLKVGTRVRFKFSEDPVTSELLNPSAYLSILYVK